MSPAIPFFCCDFCGDAHATVVCPLMVRTPAPPGPDVFLDTEARVWVAHDERGDVYSQGETESEAKEAPAGGLKMIDDYVRNRRLRLQ